MSTGGVIRTLSVSLIAVAAIATSLLMARARPERPVEDRLLTKGDQPSVQELDAIRAAGL
ncbi:MAG: hypothetical protein WEB88_09845 [Gemmatimonadota bacterium]